MFGRVITVQCVLGLIIVVVLQVDFVTACCKHFYVGPIYGRKLMTGFLASQSFRCSQIRVGE